jgi:hypothetical protein
MSSNQNSTTAYVDSSYVSIFDRYKIGLLGLLGVVVIVFVALFSLFGNKPTMNNASANSPSGSRPYIVFLEFILWVLLIAIVVINIRWIQDKQIDFYQEIRNLFSPRRNELDVHIKGKAAEAAVACPDPDAGSEVFHIPQNKYDYESASEKCRSMNARLATYDEVEKAYTNGANWCSYGWSADQMALFPIQKAVFNELKGIPGHEHDCGRPGVNGGYMPKKNDKYGVNCFGKKPAMTDKDKTYMEQSQYSPAFSQKDMDEAKKKASELLIAPFNKSKWSYVETHPKA